MSRGCLEPVVLFANGEVVVRPWQNFVALPQQGRDLSFRLVHRIFSKRGSDDELDLGAALDLSHHGGVGCMDGVVLVALGSAALALKNADDLERHVAQTDGQANGIFATWK